MEYARIAARMRRARRELDSCAEQVERLARTIERTDEDMPAVEVVGLYEFAELAGRPVATFYTYRTRGILPPTIAELKSGPVWLKHEAEQWAIDRWGDTPDAARQPTAA